MNDIDIRRIDGTLLLVFREVLASGKLTRAADRLNLTQPAVSHAVQRLRNIFDDPLFVRSGAGMAPTVRAKTIAPKVEAALAALEGALDEGRKFDLRRTERVFVIDTLDYAAALIGPDINRALAADAPRARVVFRTYDRAASRAGFEDGTIDLRIGIAAGPEPDLIAEPLFEEQFEVLARRNHPALAEGMTIERYCEADHVLVAAGAPSVDAALLRGAADDALATIGRHRRVAVVVPQFLTAFVLVRDSDALLTAPRKLASRYANVLGLNRYSPPFNLSGFRLSLFRSAGAANDPAIDWLAAACRRALLSV